MSIKRWVLPALDKEAAAQLSEDCEINPFLALLLITRGIRNTESAADFLIGGDIADDPFGFADMDLAVDRLQRAMDSHEKIAVYGDYDADGITSAVLLYSYLKDKGSDVLYYLPNRETEGYGLHTSSIDYLQEQGVRLIVTVDNGISAAEEVAYAKKKGIDVVVTDHHQPSVPAAVYPELPSEWRFQPAVADYCIPESCLPVFRLPHSGLSAEAAPPDRVNPFCRRR